MFFQYPPRSHVTRHDEATVGGTNDGGNCGFVSPAECLEARYLYRHKRTGRVADCTSTTKSHREVLANRGPEVQSWPPPHSTDLDRQLHLYISAAFAFHLTLFFSLPSSSTHQLTHYFYYLLIDLGRPLITHTLNHTLTHLYQPHDLFDHQST
jgi:hypothetical protein